MSGGGRLHHNLICRWCQTKGCSVMHLRADVIWMNLDRLEEWTDRNLRKFSKNIQEKLLYWSSPSV